jgi:hypothetical protein
MTGEADLPIRSALFSLARETVALAAAAIADRARGGGVTSARRREANRRNARSSTGPRTSAGKARAAQNARRHGLSLPARYDPSRWDEIEALARAIVGADADAERLELARRIAEAQIDIIRARSARRDLFPACPAALRERTAIARLAAVDRYERRAWARRKRAIRALDDAYTVERAGDVAGDLAERSQLQKADRPACVAPPALAAGSPEPERRASSDAPFGNLAERSQPELAEQSQRASAEPSQGELAERSQRETFRVETASRHFGRTKPIAALTIASSVRPSGCHRPRKRTIQYSSNAVRGSVFSAIGSARSTGCPAYAGHDKREMRYVRADDSSLCRGERKQVDFASPLCVTSARRALMQLI